MPSRSRFTFGSVRRRTPSLHAFLVVLLILPGLPAMALEKPSYRVVETHDDFEVREYPSYVVAETEVEGQQTEVGNEAFSRLGGYIFGKNRGERKLAMTAPVAQAPAEGLRLAMTAPVAQSEVSRGVGRAWVVQFMMPSQYTLDTLPEPRDSRVTLRALPPRRCAALRYSGTWSQANYDAQLARLRAGLQRQGLTPKGEPVWARYDPPYTPWFLRTNEILIEVAGASGEASGPVDSAPGPTGSAPDGGALGGEARGR